MEQRADEDELIDLKKKIKIEREKENKRRYRGEEKDKVNCVTARIPSAMIATHTTVYNILLDP